MQGVRRQGFVIAVCPTSLFSSSLWPLPSSLLFSSSLHFCCVYVLGMKTRALCISFKSQFCQSLYLSIFWLQRISPTFQSSDREFKHMRGPQAPTNHAALPTCSAPGDLSPSQGGDRHHTGALVCPSDTLKSDEKAGYFFLSFFFSSSSLWTN